MGPSTKQKLKLLLQKITKAITTKAFVLTLFYVLLFLIGFFGSYLYLAYKKVKVPDSSVNIPVKVNPATGEAVDPLAPKNILLLGMGGSGHSGGALTDAIMLVRVAPRNETLTFISIPRDLWVDLPSGANKINEAYHLEGGPLIKHAVSQVTGLSIDHFVAIDFESFKKVVDILGGVEVDVPVAFRDEYYPVKGLENETCDKTPEEIDALHATMSGYLLERQFKCRYETLEFDVGKASMDGETALKFVRSRHSTTGGSDFGRSLRQQALLTAVKDKMVALSSVDKIIPIINTVTDYVKTDIDINEALEILKQYKDVPDTSVKQFSLTTDNVLEESTSSSGQYILLPKGGDWSTVHEFVSGNLED